MPARHPEDTNAPNPPAFGPGTPYDAQAGAGTTTVEVTPFGAASQILDQAARGEWPSAGGLMVVALWAVALTAAAARWFRWQ